MVSPKHDIYVLFMLTVNHPQNYYEMLRFWHIIYLKCGWHVIVSGLNVFEDKLLLILKDNLVFNYSIKYVFAGLGLFQNLVSGVITYTAK